MVEMNGRKFKFQIGDRVRTTRDLLGRVPREPEVFTIKAMSISPNGANIYNVNPDHGLWAREDVLELIISGKFVCVRGDGHFFTAGKVYTIDENGEMNNDRDFTWKGVYVHDINELNRRFEEKLRIYCFVANNYPKFIEFKGE